MYFIFDDCKCLCQKVVQKITFTRHLLELLPFCEVFNFLYKRIKYIRMAHDVKNNNYQKQNNLVRL